MSVERRPYEILEHTADVGLRAHGRSLRELFENACRGTLEIMGASGSSLSRRSSATLEASDEGGLLVDLLNELIYIVDSEGARVAACRVEIPELGRAVATFDWAPSREELNGTELKAATYHRLAVETWEDGYTAEVYFDV